MKRFSVVLSSKRMVKRWKNYSVFFLKTNRGSFSRKIRIRKSNQVEPHNTFPKSVSLRDETKLQCEKSSKETKVNFDLKTKQLPQSTEMHSTKCRQCGKLIKRFYEENQRFKSDISPLFLQGKKKLIKKNTSELCSVNFHSCKNLNIDKCWDKTSSEWWDEDDPFVTRKYFRRVCDGSSKEEEWIKTGSVKCLLEGKEPLGCRMSDKTRNSLLTLIEIKRKFKKSLSKLENQLLILTEKTRLLSTMLNSGNDCLGES